MKICQQSWQVLLILLSFLKPRLSSWTWWFDKHIIYWSFIFIKLCNMIFSSWLTPKMPSVTWYLKLFIFQWENVISSKVNCMNLVILFPNNYILQMSNCFEDCGYFRTLFSFFKIMKGFYIILVVQTSIVRIFPRGASIKYLRSKIANFGPPPLLYAPVCFSLTSPHPAYVRKIITHPPTPFL